MEELPDSFGPVLDAAAPLAERFLAAGHGFFLVGGVVRDRLLGVPFRPGDDIDCTTEAEPEVIHRIVAPVAEAVWLQGVGFGTVGCTVGGRAFEITTHRAEQYRSTSRKPVVVFSSDIGTDLSRRDFTVNAMAVSLPDGVLIDPFGGREDLAGRVLRTPLAPGISFDDDPLRMLRAARFVAALALRPADELEEAVAARVGRMAIVSAERVHEELRRLLSLDAPSAGLRFLRRTGLLAAVLPEAATVADEAFERMTIAVDAVPDEFPEDRDDGVLARFVTLLCGASPGEEAPGAWVTVLREHVRGHAAHLRWSRHEERLALELARLVPVVVRHGPSWTAAETRALVADAGCPLPLLVATGRAAAAAAGLPAVGVEGFAASVEQIAAIEGLEVDGPLDGREVMELLGVGPGETVGRALAEVRRWRIEGGPMSREEAVARLRDWWAGYPGRP